MNKNDIKQIAKQFCQSAARYATPLMLHDKKNKEVLFNGTIGFIEPFAGADIFAITAYHVYEKILHHDMMGSINGFFFDFKKQFVSGNKKTDIATFKIDKEFILKTSKTIIENTFSSWPPPKVQEGKGMFFCGFPGVGRTVINENHINLDIFAFCGVANSVSDTMITLHMNSDYIFDDKFLPPKDYDFGGISGAPVLACYENMTFHWTFGGIIYESYPTQGIFLIRPASLIDQYGIVKVI